ncbi:arrestin-like protein [Ophiostoma piceae UAMH 11346]|uniref:Arrestin-like protein n=1 Tax=Ophiostoma piceae (strain UAMH 11346) TaxID=1262450 RepID=S3C8C9_OPHP1|nr:arrestin-like protein [Ophiostoma piceae UAMH 11346]
MAVRIVLFDSPDYYTNLDTIRGEVRFRLTRPENIGTVVVKLEGESSTSLTVPTSEDEKGWTFKAEPLSELDSSKTPGATTRPAPGTVFDESHKVLYQVTQVYPPRNEEPPSNGWLPAAEYSFPFQFKIPINNACADPVQLARSGGVVDSAGNLESPTAKLIRFGVSSTGIRIMDGSKQLQYKHVKQTLPPSFDGFLSSTDSTDIRYFIKATVQRPGIFKGNWRNSYSFRFLPIEPLREPLSVREVFARRPFTFRERSEQTEAPSLRLPKKKSTFFRTNSGSTLSLPDGPPGSLVSAASATPSPALPPSPLQRQATLNATCKNGLAPSILLTTLLPYKPILTCNEAIPLRITARKLEPSREEVFLTSLEIRLTGTTRVKSQDLEQTKLTKWMVVSSPNLSIPVSEPDAPVGSEIIIPSHMWCDKVLPDTVMPSFMTCNVSRSYQLEIRAGLTWNTNPLDDPFSSVSDAATPIAGGKVQSKKEQKATQKAIRSAKSMPAHLLPQTIILPLVFESVEVYSGIKLNKALVEVAHKHRQRMSMLQEPRPPQQRQYQNRPQPQLLDSHPIHQSRPHPPHVNTRGPPPGMHRPYHQQMNQYPNQHPVQYQQRQMGGPHQMPEQRTPPQRPQQAPEQQIFELPSEPVPVLPPRSDSSANASPMTPSDPSFPHVSPISPEAVEMHGTSVIRRRPVPPQFLQQQREEQQRRENPEKFPSGEYPSSGTNFGQVHGSVHRHGPRQQYHMYQQQTTVSPLYPPQLQPGEDPASLAQPMQSPLSSPSSGGGSAGGASAGIVAQNGTVLVSYNGVVSTMVQDVASAIDAFSFADGDTASIYQEPPPSYDEAIAETITAVAEEGDYRAQRPTFNV